jgi:hypothetical protein
MEEYKLYFKFSKWPFIFLIIGYIMLSIYAMHNISFILKNFNGYSFYEKTIFIVSEIGIILANIFGWYVIIGVKFFNNYYYIINEKGIYNNQCNLLKKYLSWDDELYYCITDSFIGIYKAKMLPVKDKIMNEKNIINGYILIKSKKALKKYYENKGMMGIGSKNIKNNVNINEIIEMLNKSRESLPN